MTLDPRPFRLLEADDPLAASRPGDLAWARHQVEAAVLEDAAEGQQARVLDLIDRRPDALRRDCLPDHLTGSALVVDATGRRTLLMLHRKLGRWFQPGGHADGQGNLLAVALKEAEEETGLGSLRPVVPALDVDVHDVHLPDGGFHVHHDLRFLLVAPAGAEARGNEESLALRWVDEHTVDDVDPDASTRRLVYRGLSLARALLA